MRVEKPNIGCIIMASGLSRRFGSNKLLADFDGKTLLERALDLTDGLFARRIVLTRSPEAAALCEELGAEVHLHALPGRGDAVGLGVALMGEMDALVFCPCDQPLLERGSVERLVVHPLIPGQILRLAFGEREGTPVRFDRVCFGELAHLPQGKGGSAVIKAHPDRVERLQARREEELMDADTPQQLEILLQRHKSR